MIRRRLCEWCAPFILQSVLICATPGIGHNHESVHSLNGPWRFAFDPGAPSSETEWDRLEWRSVNVPHTWQVENGHESYYGVAWYERRIPADVLPDRHRAILEFDAVHRDARVYFNGQLAMEHIGGGWTPFQADVTDLWNNHSPNSVRVRVDNRFSEHALPYKHSFDWANDGGIIRGVRLKILPPSHIQQVHIESRLSGDLSTADVEIAITANISPPGGELRFITTVVPPDANGIQTAESAAPDGDGAVALRQNLRIANPTLWHFDHPHLYQARIAIRTASNTIVHEKTIPFGIRKIEVKEGFYFLNNEPMRLMGVEWMPGSDPRYGMAESPQYARSVLEDLKRLNCVITRFHWQQDKSVFDFCDTNGILAQEEIPAWGGTTNEGDLAGIQAMQMREMINAHKNHPSIYAWGICNELGEHGKAYEFVQRGIELGRQLDPGRLLVLASNGLQAADLESNPQDYASSLADFLEWNDYWESWYGGALEDLNANLERIRNAFPGKSLVISEYGLCECHPGNPSGDARRIEILKTHTDTYRRSPNVAGAIFFNYNDYRTHIGDKGQGSFRQRVHGVVDVFNRPKPSWNALRYECSPIKTFRVESPKSSGESGTATVRIETRSLEDDFPAYTLRGYELTWIAFNEFNQPAGTGKMTLPDMIPGSVREIPIEWPTFESLQRIEAEVFRPTGYSVIEAEWVREG